MQTSKYSPLSLHRHHHPHCLIDLFYWQLEFCTQYPNTSLTSHLDWVWLQLTFSERESKITLSGPIFILFTLTLWLFFMLGSNFFVSAWFTLAESTNYHAKIYFNLTKLFSTNAVTYWLISHQLFNFKLEWQVEENPFDKIL
jgi:hypothetical protein